ncbi:hypothetical protein [uncultured Enterovirga sp.]|uniref:hypothetical protein n=1 Tax=uncultured Enterovirga sp. TaxID=2026352 RepID=UPI0035CB4D76
MSTKPNGQETASAAARPAPAPARHNRKILCHLCCSPLAKDDRHHYGYQCHACVIREHDLVLMVAKDPDHPEAGWLELSPVEFARRDPNRTA